MQKSIVQILLIGISVIGVAGCPDLSHQIPQGEESPTESSYRPRQLQDLAGTWEYEDKTGSNMGLLNIAKILPVHQSMSHRGSPEKNRECSKRPVQQGRSRLDERSVRRST